MQNDTSAARIPTRPGFMTNKVLVVDGLVGGGKALISQILAALPQVEMWIHREELEQICAMHSLGHISTDGAVTLIRSWIDSDACNVSMLRNVNCRPADQSSILRYPRRWSYLRRFFQEGQATSLERFIKNSRILNFMTHANTAYSSSIFQALNDRLVYVRMARCPMTEYMVTHIARWTKRWGTDVRSGTLLHKCDATNEPNNSLPFAVAGHEQEYLDSSPLERAVLLLSIWQTKGDQVLDAHKRNYPSTVIEIPYEHFVFRPRPYIDRIASALEVTVDRTTRREMRAQGVPRRSLTDAPPTKSYIRMGWKPPAAHLTVEEELSSTSALLKTRLPRQAFLRLSELCNAYLQRHSIM